MRGWRREHSPDVTEGDLQQTATRANRRGQHLWSRALKDVENES